MTTKKKLPDLRERIRGRVLEKEPLSRHTTFGVGGPVRFWVEPKNAEDLRYILSVAKKERIKTVIIGSGSNILAHDKMLNAIAIHLGSPYFKKISFYKSYVKAGAGMLLEKLIISCCLQGLGGLEGLTGIPGTVGGAVFMNSSAAGSIEGFLDSVKVMDGFGRIKVLRRKNLNFEYRNSNLSGYIILEAMFKLRKSKKEGLLAKRKDFLKFKSRIQPLYFKSAGCIFKNPENKPFSAGQLIDLSGLKGKRLGDAQVSPRHANFIVNLKNAKSSDIIALIDLIRKRVKRDYHITLVPEVKIL